MSSIFTKTLSIRGLFIFLSISLLGGVAFGTQFEQLSDDAPAHQIKVFEIGRKLEQSLSAKYPQTQFTVDDISFFNESDAQQGKVVLTFLLESVEQDRLRKDLNEIIISRHDPGAVKISNDGKKIAFLNLLEATHLRQANARFNYETSDNVACEKLPFRPESIKHYFILLRELEAKKTMISVTQPAEWRDFNIDLSLEPQRLITLSDQLTETTYVARANFKVRVSPLVLSKARGCRTFDCFMAGVFGDLDKGLLIGFLLDKYGLNASYAWQLGMIEDWDLERLQKLVEALREAPPFALKAIHSKPVLNERSMRLQFSISKIETSKSGFNATNNDKMVFYKSFFEQPPLIQKGLVLHELSHYVYGDLIIADPSFEMAWASLSLWTQEPDATRTLPQWKHPEIIDNFVTEYAGVRNPNEDFAETFRFYRYDPSKLLEVAPEKYEFMKNKVFNGLEYLNDKTCALRAI